MRKMLSLVLVPLLLMSMVVPAFGSGYREIAEAYLNEKYGGNDVIIQMYEGGITELEFTGESFWFAKYDISKAGKSVPAPDTPIKPEPAIRPEIMQIGRAHV